MFIKVQILKILETIYKINDDRKRQARKNLSINES